MPLSDRSETLRVRGILIVILLLLIITEYYYYYCSCYYDRFSFKAWHSEVVRLPSLHEPPKAASAHLDT